MKKAFFLVWGQCSYPMQMNLNNRKRWEERVQAANVLELLKDIKDIQIDQIKVAGRRLPVASLKSLLKLKEEAGRPQDKLDIEMIKEKLNEK